MTSTAASVDGDPTAALPVLEPADAAELAAALAAAREAGLAVLPRGGGTKMDWGNPPRRADVVLSTRKLNRVLEHTAGDLTVTVEAGCTVNELQRTVAEHNQRLAIDPLWPERATVGGVLATNDNGSLRGSFGGLRDLVIGMTVALPSGTLARSGGKVVKNVAGYDLPKLMVGSFGTLGVITQATFRLHSRPRTTCDLSTEAATPDLAQRIVLGIRDSNLPVTALQVRALPDAPLRVDVRLGGSGAAVDKASRLMPVAAELASGTWGSLEDVWDEREQLFARGPGAAVAQVTFLPMAIASLCHAVGRAVPSAVPWVLLAQGHGVGWLRVDAPNENGLAAILTVLRREAVSRGGSLALLRADASVRRQVDAWGESGDAFALMRRVKQQFDPQDTLNPGRFIGGI
jgi:glycolate oxidase FAD binding subunit